MTNRNGKRCFFFVVLLAWTLALLSCSQDPVESQYRRGESLFEKGEFSSAVEVYRKIATYTPDSSWAPEALYQSGLINYLYLKNYEGAVDDFAHLVYYYPKSKNAFDAQAKIVGAGCHVRESVRPMLDVDEFMSDGYAKIEQAASRSVAHAARAALWQQLGPYPAALSAVIDLPSPV